MTLSATEFNRVASYQLVANARRESILHLAGGRFGI